MNRILITLLAAGSCALSASATPAAPAGPGIWTDRNTPDKGRPSLDPVMLIKIPFI